MTKEVFHPFTQKGLNQAAAYLFKMANKPSAWTEIMAMVRKKPEYASARGEKWNETLLHWAAMSDIAAVMELCSLRKSAPEDRDFENRVPLDWVMEKLLFLSEESSSASKRAYSEQEKILSATASLLSKGADSHSMDMTWAEKACRSGSASSFVALWDAEAIKWSNSESEAIVFWSLGQKEDQADLLDFLMKNVKHGIRDGGDGKELDIIADLYLAGKVRKKRLSEMEAAGLDPYVENEQGFSVFERLTEKSGIAEAKRFAEAFSR